MPVLPAIQSVTGDTNAERFESFHRLNPAVYRAIVQISRELQKRGWFRCSMNMIFERIRWSYAVQTQGDPYLLNNNWRAYYARLVMAAESDLSDFFSVRQQRDGWAPDPVALGVAKEPA